MARQGDNSYLVLTDTDNENSGVYMASASNSHGESKSYGRLSVNESTTINGVTTSKSSTIEKRSTSGGSPKKGGQPPEFKKLFYDRHVQAGEAVRIDAVITGSPKPRIKWFFNNDVPQENCRCIMAGDTYSFIIDEFEEKNCGRYTIQAENNYGKASCSAECLFEGSEFMGSENAPALETGNIITEEIYSKNGPANSMTSSYSQSQTIRTESKSIETIPVNTRDLSIQSSIPQMKDTSSQIQYNTKDLGIQINPDQRDKGSQLNQSSNTEIKSYSNQMAPLVQNSEESHFSSVNESRSYSYSQSSHVVDSSSGGTRVRIDSKDPTVGITIRATPERNNSASHIDFSTTLIKDINQNKNQHQFEPVELILNSSNTRSGASPYREMHSSSNAYVEESYHHKPQTRYEPVNLIVQKPTCGMGRSGSLPPIKSRVNYKQSHHHRNDFNETDEEIIHVNHCHNKENTHSYGQESKMSYYKDIERRSANRSNQFKPVELVLDASTLSDSDREPHVHVRHHTHGSQHQLHQRHHHHQQHLHRGSVSSVDERYSHHHQTEYPTMEMTIDVKSPPSIDVPLRNAQATEGHAVKLECVVSGKPNPTMKWYKEGNEIDPNTSDNVIISYDSNLGLAVLIIKQVSFNDTGRFTCVARNALGSCSTSASVNVQGHGKKSPSPRSQSDSPVRKVKQFEPGFYQTKPATMTFNPNNQAISYQQAIQSYSTHKPVNFYSQTEVKPTQNNVQMMPSMPQQPQRVENVHRIVTATKPQIVKHLQNQTVQPGNKALMQCVVKGSPDEVKWFHNGNPCNLSSQAPRFPITYDKFTGLTTMSIINARPEDAGQITCIASNSAGTDTSTAWLVVKEPSVEKPMYQPPQQPQQPFKINAGPVHRPKETTPLRFGNIESAKVPEAPMRAQSAPQKPVEIVRAYQKYPEVAKPQEQPQIVDPSQVIRPRIIEPLKNVEFVEGGQAVFECRVEGNPLNVQWFKGPRELFNQFRYKMAFDPSTGIARMMIGTVLEDDAGDYTCRVSNPIGDANTTGALVPMMKQPPTDFWNKKPSIPIGEPVPPKPSNKNKPLMEELGQRQRERKASRQPSERPPSTNAYPDEVFDNKPNDMQPLPAKILKGLKNEQFRENDTIVLKALIAGYPYPRASWFKNNMPLVMSQRHSCHNDEGKRICGVKIKNATPEDSGVYSLVVENPYGADDSSCQIVVMPPEPRMRQMSVDSVPYSPVPEQAYPVKFEESQNAIPPKFVVGLPPNDKIVEGEPIRLSCQVEGSPKPNITWLKDGNPLPTSLRFTTDYNPQTGVATLNVAGTLSNDCGTYTAVAENPAGKAYTTSQVMIKQPHRYDSQDDSCASDTDVPLNRAKPPKVIHGLRDVKEKEGNPINMACKIDGFPKPTLTWLKNGAPLQASNRYNTTYDLNTGVARLKINDTVLGDAGVYSVIAENKAGQDQTNGRLEIIKDSNIDDKPIVNPQAFQYIQPPPPTPPMEAFGPGHLRRGPSPAPRQREPSTQPIPVNLKPIPDSIYVPNDDENKPLSPPKVVVPLKDLRVSEGAPVNLMTKIIGYPIPMIKWLHNNRPVNESSRFTTNYDHTTGIASFKINGTQANDIGTYTAIAENPAGSADTTSKLALTPVSLIDTNPIVNPNAFRYLEKPTRERPRDDSADTPVSAIKPPKFVVPLSNITVKQGAHTDLLCKLEGYPFPTVSWFKDNKPLPASNRLITNYNLNSGLVYLKIADTQLGDAGYYTAVAENKAGQDQTFCSIQVTEQPNVDCTPMVNPDAFRYLENHPSDRNPRPDDEQLKPPKVIIPLSNVKLEEGQKVQLACKIEGSPRPKLTWFKDGEPLPAANRFTTNYDYYTNIAELKIDNASMNDVGSYVCLAENKVGKDQTFCSIFVKEMPNVDETPLVNPEAFKYLENPPKDAAPNTDDENVNLEPPKVIIPLKDMIIKEGEPVLLVSKIIGKPKPKLTWYKNDEPLMASQRYDIEHNLSTNVGMLNIKQAKAQDIGTYRVMAENAAGKCDTQGKLFVENVPNIDETAYINPSKFRALDDPKNPLNADDSDSGEKQPVLIVNPLEDQECFEGETVMFICDLTGSPKPTINWTKDGAPLQAAQRLAFNYIINEGKAIFLISNVKTDDQGEYTVTGKNSAGQASSSAKLKVKSVPSVDDTSYVNPDVFQKFDLKKTPEVSAPADKNSRLKIVEPLKDFHLVEGNKAIFYCKIDAYPKAETQWYKDGAPLAASQRVMTSYNMHSGVATLVIEGATANDKGTYKCVASNIAGTDETSAKLIIQVAPNIDETSYINPDALRKLNHVLPGAHPEDPNDEKYKKPYFVKVPKNTEVPEGSFIRLDCLAFGRPTPVLTWYKDGKELKEDAGHKTLINEEGVHSLLINAATFDDSGTYSCVARNKVGEASFSIDLKVVDKDAHIAPHFIEHLKNVIIPEGKDAVLSATCSGKPQPTVSWQKNDKPVNEKEYRIDTNGGHSKLHIVNATKNDEGWYQCSAVNPAGSTVTKTKVSVIPVGAVNVMNPDLSHLIKQPPQPEVPNFVKALGKLKHVKSGLNPVEPEKERDYDPVGQNFGSIWSKDELQDEETMYDKDRPIPPKFKTQFKAQLNLRERDTAHYEAKLIPIGDPTMKIEWLRNGEPLRSAARYEIKYDFGFVSLNILWSYPEDDGIYECVATNAVGQDKTRAELKCKGNRSIIYDSQLPDGMEGYLKIQERDDKLKQAMLVHEEAEEEETPDPAAPEILMKLEDNQVDEGGMVKFMTKITGYPKPRVTWFVNKTHAISGSRFKLKFDGMIHYLDIPKTSKLDEGTVRCYAKNIHGEVETSCLLKVNPKADFRALLKNPKTGERHQPEPEPVRERMTTPERTILDRLPMLNPHHHHKQKPVDNRILPVFTKQLEPTKVNEGISILLEVEYNAIPVPEVFWYKDGFQMQSSNDFFIESTSNKSTLKIREAFKSDSGMYQVKLFNEMGSAASRAYFTVVPANLSDLTPTILLQLKNINCNSGDPIKFQSQAIGNPSPVITWFKDDEKLEMSSRIKEFQEDNTYTCLIVETAAADSGCYEMVAENAHGKVYTRAYLTVLGDAQVEDPKPIEVRIDENNVRSVPVSSKFTQPAINVPIKDQTVNEGSPVKFECDIANSDQATVEWFKEDPNRYITLIKQSKYFNMQTEKNKHTLNILEAFPEDEGQYKCVVKNPAGQVTTAAFLKIKQNAQIPVILNKITDTTVDENQAVEFTARVSGEPTPQVEWSHKGEILKNGVNFQIQSDKSGIHTLKLKQARTKDAGDYKFRAFTSAGSVECQATLFIKNVNAALTNNQLNPNAILFAQGSNARIEVHFDNQFCRNSIQPTSFNWFFNNIKIKQSKRFSIINEKEKSLLVINDLQKSHTGTYTIQAVGKNLQPKAEINIDINKSSDDQVKKYEFVRENMNYVLMMKKEKPKEDDKQINSSKSIEKNEKQTKEAEKAKNSLETQKTKLSEDLVKLEPAKAVDEPVKSVKKPIKPVKEPVEAVGETVKAAEEPVKLVEEPVKAAEEPVKPVEESVKPVEESVKAVEEPVKVVEEPIKALDEPVKDVEEPVKAVEKPIKFLEESVKNVDEPVNALEEPVKAIDEKVKAAEEPVKPVGETVKSIDQPVKIVEETIKPVEEPVKVLEEAVKAAEEPVKPVEEPVKPVGEPVKAAEEPLEPVEEPVKPVEEPVKAIDESVKLVEEPVKVVEEPVKALEKPVKAAEEPVKPVEESVKVVEEAVNALEEPVKVVEEPIKALDEPVKDVDESVKVVEKPVNALEEPVTAIGETVKAAEEPVNPVGETVKPVGKTVKAAEEPVKALEEPIKAAEDPVKPVEESVKPVEESVKAVDEAVKSIDQPVKVVEEPIKALEEPVKAVDESVKVVEEPVNTLEERVKAIGETVKAAEEPVKPVGETVKAAKEPIKPVEEPVKIAEEPVKPVGETVKPVEEPVKSIDQPVKVVEEPIKPVEEPVKVLEEPVKAAEEPVKPVEEPVKAVGEPVKALDEPVKPVEEPVKAIDESVKVLEEPVKAVEEPVKSVDEPVKVVEQIVKAVEEPESEVTLIAGDQLFKPQKETLKNIYEVFKDKEEPVEIDEESVNHANDTAQSIEKPLKVEEKQENLHEETLQVKEILVKSQEEPIKNDQFAKLIEEPEKFQVPPVETEEPYRLEETPSANDSNHSAEKLLNAENQSVTTSLTETDRESSQEIMNKHREEMLFGKNNSLKTTSQNKLEMKSELDSNNKFHKKPRSPKSIHAPRVSEDKNEDKINWQELNSKSSEEALNNVDSSFTTISNISKKSEDSSPKITDDILNLITEINESTPILVSGSSEAERIDNSNFKIENPMNEIIDQFGNFLTTSQDTFTTSQDSFAEIERQVIAEEQEVEKAKNSAVKAPTFSQKLVDLEFQDRDNLHLDCFVQGHQPILIEWYLNGELIMPSDDSNIEIFRESGVCSLEIISANSKYEGEFKCHASNAFGYDTTICVLKMQKSENLNKIEFTEYLQDQIVEFKSEVFLDCTIINMRKTDRIEWFLNHSVIVPDSDENIEIFTESGVCSLQIRQMTHELQGYFACKVLNADGYVLNESGCFVNVEEPSAEINVTRSPSKLSLFTVVPSFVIELNKVTVIREGEKLALNCRINKDCDPKPTILWFRDGQLLKEGQGLNTSMIYDKESGDCKLVIDNCEKFLNQGIYLCTAAIKGNSEHFDYICKTMSNVKIISNDNQSVYESSSDEKMEHRGIPPMFLQSLEDVELEEGEELELKCQIMGAPIPEVACFYAKNISEQTSIKRVRSELLDYNYETGIFRIIIKNTSNEANEGFYMVKAVNEAGSLTTVCQVKVKCKSYPVLKVDNECAPEFMNELNSEIKAMDGQQVSLTCICKSLPVADIKWLRNTPEDVDKFIPVMLTNDIKSSYDIETGKVTLKICDAYPQDTGVYKCTASNDHGKAETRTSLTIEPYTYEQDSEEGSACMPSVNNTDTEGTLTPTPYRQYKRTSDTSPYLSDNSSLMLEQSKQLIKALRENQKSQGLDKTLTETDYFSPASDSEMQKTESASNSK